MSSARLPIIKQDCQVCPLQTKCWDTSRNPSAEVLVINLLVCRLKLGIKVDASAKEILRLLAPKIQSIANFIQRRCDVTERGDLVADIQSAIIETLMSNYKLGERAWPLYYLFARPRGVISGWAMRYIDKRRADARNIPLGYDPSLDWERLLINANAVATQGRIQEGPHALSYDGMDVLERAFTKEDDALADSGNISIPRPQDIAVATVPVEGRQVEFPYHATLSIVDDGRTLTAREFRVFAFCLRHAGDKVRGDTPVSGLHRHLGEKLGLDRSTVSRVFRRASSKIIEMTGRTDDVLGVALPAEVDLEARRQRILGVAAQALTPDEEQALIELAADVGGATACRAFGVHTKTLTALKKRHENETDARARDRADHDEHGLSA